MHHWHFSNTCNVCKCIGHEKSFARWIQQTKLWDEWAREMFGKSFNRRIACNDVRSFYSLNTILHSNTRIHWSEFICFCAFFLFVVCVFTKFSLKNDHIFITIWGLPRCVWEAERECKKMDEQWTQCLEQYFFFTLTFFCSFNEIIANLTHRANDCTA